MAEAFVFHVGLRRPLAPPEMLRVMPEVQRLLPRDCCVQVLPEVVCVFGPPDGRGGFTNVAYCGGFARAGGGWGGRYVGGRRGRVGGGGGARGGWVGGRGMGLPG